MNQKKHYHVLAGESGYLPDYNEVYDSEADAIIAMHDLADLFNDQIADEENAGYYEWDSVSQSYWLNSRYIEVVDCDCDTCEGGK
jgi:hypothetical protein